MSGADGEKNPERSPDREAPATGKGASEGEAPAPDFWTRLKANARTIVGAVLFALVIRMVLVEPFQIEGPSMEPTLFDGDRVIVAKYPFGLRLPFTEQAAFSWGVPRRGQVVIATSPADGLDVVKRVIGIPGDRITVDDDIVILNGARLARRMLRSCGGSCEVWEERIAGNPYLTSRDRFAPPQEYPYGELRVPAGHVFLLGDHRDRSNDSRFFGPVSIARVKGSAVWIYWSYSPREGARWNRIGSSLH